MTTKIELKLSPNFTKGTRPKIGYIVHGTLGKYEGAIEWLCTPPEKRPVVSYSSAHYVIAKDGRVTQLVNDNDVSWHAGNISNPTSRAKEVLPSYLGKYLNPNESFIGIELEWFLGDIITEAQYLAVIDIIKRGGIKNPVILCHKEVTDYKSDFQDKNGKLDMTVVNNILRMLQPTVQPPIQPDEKVMQYHKQLTSQLANKDYKGARDTTSYLFNELTKLK